MYGSLMEGLPGRAAAGVGAGLHQVGPCRIPGRLMDLGEYPGLVPGEGTVTGELCRVEGPEVLAALDRFERHRPGEPARSLFLRGRVELVEPEVEAWVYVYNRPVQGVPPVPSGDWRRHLAER